MINHHHHSKIKTGNFSFPVLLLWTILGLSACTPASDYQSKIIQTENGWGYEIVSNHKIIIHQTHIPAIASQIPFHSKEDAEKTANRVIEKLSDKQMPTITKKDLAALKIKVQ
jgi:hypothetical protein